MAKIAKVGMKTDIWHTSSKERPRPASQYRAIFDVLNHKLQKIKWKWQHIQSGKTGHRQNYLHLSLALLCVSSIPSHPIPTPLLAFPQLWARAYIWPGSLLSPKKTELITLSHWAGVGGSGWQPHHVTDVMNDPGQIPSSPQTSVPSLQEKIRLSSGSLLALNSVLRGC